MKIDLYEMATAIFVINASGASNDTTAQCELRNDKFGVVWDVESVVIQTNSPQTYGQSQFFLYLNSVSASGLRDSTYNGDQATDETSVTVRTGERLIAIWNGGDAGSLATITIRGTRETGRAS